MQNVYLFFNINACVHPEREMYMLEKWDIVWKKKEKYRVRINYRRILQNRILTNTEQKYIMLLPFDRGMFAVS
jgi:hypothetical protein